MICLWSFVDFNVNNDGVETERMVGYEAGKVVWDLTTEKKEINICISFNS